MARGDGVSVTLTFCGVPGASCGTCLGSNSDFQPSGVVALSSTSRAASLPSLRNTTVSWLFWPA
jgi:homoaconitase/3-isopropylmalate dehydratase large subunit